MSGAEAIAVLSTISAAITIVQGSQHVYQAAHDAKGLHEAFKKVSETVPLVLDILRHAERVFTTPDGAPPSANLEEAAKAALPVMATCEENARQLRDIFERVVPGAEAGRRERYRKALQSVAPGKTRKVEELMKEILERLQLLHTYQAFKDAARSQKLEHALQEMQRVPSSMPEEDGQYVHSGSGSLNVNPGTGTQNNYTMSGGSGTMNNAQTQYIGTAPPQT